MNAKRIAALVAAALVMGLVAGNVASSFAATATSPSAGSGAGLRLGVAMRDSGGRLLDVVAKLTGTSTEAVVAERQAGKTYTQIAAAKNVKAVDRRRRGAEGPHRRSDREGQERRDHAGTG